MAGPIVPRPGRVRQLISPPAPIRGRIRDRSADAPAPASDGRRPRHRRAPRRESAHVPRARFAPGAVMTVNDPMTDILPALPDPAPAPVITVIEPEAFAPLGRLGQ